MKPSIAERIAQFAPSRITAEVSHLPKPERAVLDKLIEAARLLEPVFDRQAYAHNPALAGVLAGDASAEGRLKLEYFGIMRGPWDRQAHFEPFATDVPRPLGAGFYPENLTREELDRWVSDHPGDREAMEGLFTIVRREGATLRAVPYSEEYAKWLRPAAGLLREAAALTENASLKAFLEARADAFLNDDYYASDKAWMDLDGGVEITIGPYETYEDDLFGRKAAFEAFVTVSDPDASAKLAKYKELLPTMEQNLPIPDEVKTRRGAESPIRVVDLVYSSGDARKSVQTLAFNLPNDERVRAEKGAKKVLLRNLIQTKFDRIMRPIAARIVDEAQLAHLSADAFFQQTLFHELSHSLGPAFIAKGGERMEVRQALAESYMAIEEAKADVMGAYNVLFMIQRGEFPASFREELLLSYFAGLFRSTRFGIAEAHGRAAAVQINRFLEEGAAELERGRFAVRFEKLEASIASLVRDICLLQHRGDKPAADAMLERYGVMSKPMSDALGSLGGIPVDIRPIYPLAGE